MRRIISILLILCLVAMPALSQEATTKNATDTPSSDTAQMRQEIEQLKKTIAAMEARLAVAEKKTEEPKAEQKDTVSVPELQAEVKELNERVQNSERKTALDRLQWSGDYRFQAHTITANVPAHFDGMRVQNLVVRSMFYMQTNGGAMPTSVAAIDNNVAAHYSDYQYFTNNLKFSDLKAAMASFPASMQQQLFSMIMPAAYVGNYSNDNSILYTNRLRLNLNSKVSDNVTAEARLSMYKVWGDSTGVQMFNGQPSTMSIDGTTTRVPNSDILRVERAYFTWNNIGGSKLYLSIGRRPSTEGPPMNYREDEPRAGTPSGGLIDYQFDGITAGYHIGEKMTLRACYGLGYESGFGSGEVLKSPGDRLKDVHFFGGNFDLYNTDKSFIQATIARAWDVTDGFNGLIVLPNNPLTGDVVGAPVLMRYTPSANLGSINLYGFNASRRIGHFDLYGSLNWESTRPNGETTPFGGLMADPFDSPKNREGHMVLFGARANVGPEDRSKLGFEFNQGSKYWFNFAQAEDDIIAPKTSTRGEVFETYFTHRINPHFIFKADYIRYDYTWSGSGWHVGAPKRLSQTPMLGFPTYDTANMFTFGLTARF